MKKHLILIVDDQATSRHVLTRIVSSVSQKLVIVTKDSATSALIWLKSHTPQLILSDYKMPAMDGLEFLRRTRQDKALTYVPFVIITSLEQRAIRTQALQDGATDFLSKPIDPAECRARFNNLLELQEQRLLLQDKAALLEKQVHAATQEIRWREEEALLLLARAGEYRDEETGNHVIRMAQYSRLIAEELGLPTKTCETIELAAPMHDIGKIGIPDGILRKNAALTDAEFATMKRHSYIGYKILSTSSSRIIEMGAMIALGHHEKYNGSGYPNKLAGNAIPLTCRIVAVADVFDALCSKRVYKRAWSMEEAVNYLTVQKGEHFDAQCVDALLQRLDDILAIRARYQGEDEHTEAMPEAQTYRSA
ncbi:Response regulator [hydrothermal vent metagenome]|uniref:Response regulator n=1 Tax=hydrothermal vent metagenome TaxID=652676 RepID=A0A3B0YQG0_9ZZZZ